MPRGRKKTVNVDEATVSTETTVATEATTTEGEKIYEKVKKQVASAKKAKGSDLTREELTQACLTSPDMIDKNGLFMGEDYEKIMSKKNADIMLKAIKNRYVYDPRKYTMRVRVYFTNELLAVAPGDPEMLASFNASKTMDAPTRDEEIQMMGAQAVTNKQREKFDRDIKNGNPLWGNWRWLGFFKARTKSLRSDEETLAATMTSYENVLNENVSFAGHFSKITIPKGKEIYVCDRPMPGDGFKRETAIKSSEAAPAGTVTAFTVQTNVLKVGNKKKGVEFILMDELRDCLDSGAMFGTGGWRGSGKKGQFLWEELDSEGKVIGGNTKYYLGITSEDPNFKDVFYDYIRHMEVDDSDDFQL